MGNTTSESLRQHPELLGIATSAVRQGLKSAFELHERLGQDGTTEVQSNPFGDTAMRGDIESEEVLISCLESLGKHIQVHSEEHGQLEVGDRALPIELTAVIDGLDGSEVYKKQPGVGRYGTMFAILEGPNPAYKDYLAAGVMEHSTSRLISAVKGRGLVVTNLRTGEVSNPIANQTATLRPDSTIYIDSAKITPDIQRYEQYYTTNKKAFAEPLTRAGYHHLRLGSSAAHFVSLATGEAELVGEATRKGSLEFATAYALVHEAQGVMVTLDGIDIGKKIFNDFGRDEHIPILAAANDELAKQAISLINP